MFVAFTVGSGGAGEEADVAGARLRLRDGPAVVVATVTVVGGGVETFGVFEAETASESGKGELLGSVCMGVSSQAVKRPPAVGPVTPATDYRHGSMAV